MTQQAMACEASFVLENAPLRNGAIAMSMLASSVCFCACRTNAPSRAEGGLPIRLMGRWDKTHEGVVRYAWSGSGFEVRFRGTGLVAQLRDPGGNRHAVWIDGVMHSTITTSANQERYVLAAGLADQQHVLSLHRSTEAFLGITSLVGLEVENGTLLTPPEGPRRRLEVVGDSISCGYGNEGKDPSCGFSPDTENHGLSYGALTARMLQAEVDTVAWSGRGIVRNYNGEGGEHMPELYDRAIPQESSANWDFSRTADAVIVNLGTNDFSTEPAPSIETFASAYADLLARIRAKYPAALILCTIGPMLVDEGLVKGRKAVAEGVEARRRAGDQKVVYYQLKATNTDPGCDWHPGLKTHRQMAEEVVAVLKPRLGW